MQAFGMGKNKFLRLTPTRRAKQLALWLRRLWLQLNRGKALQWDLFFQEYRQLCAWSGLPLPQTPLTGEAALRKEFLADQYQFWLSEQGKRLQEEDYLPLPWGDDLHEGAWQPTYDYWLALDNLRSAFNLGALCRLLDALGFAGFITSGITPRLHHRGVKKTALGSELWIPEVRVEDLTTALREKKAAGYPLIGLERVQGAVQAHRFVWPKKAVLLLGNEEYGIAQKHLTLLDHAIELPMRGRKNSLNVATSFAAAAFLATASLDSSC